MDFIRLPRKEHTSIRIFMLFLRIGEKSIFICSHKEVNIMPSEKILQKKKEVVKELAKRMESSCAGVIVDYKGITVIDDTKLRADLRNAGVKYTVVKNSLMRLAVQQIGFDDLTSVLTGTTALAVSEKDPIAPAKILSSYASKNKNFTVKAGFIEGRPVTSEEVKALASLPSREVLVAQVLAGLNAPITGFVNVLAANMRGLVVALNAIAEKKGA